MKILKSQLLQLIKEETQGELEFADLEAARRAYIEDRNDDTRHELGLMVEKLVEPIMAELGLFFEAEAFYNRGELVFTNYRDTEVTIDPDGIMGRYDVQVYPLAGAEDDVSPSETSVNTMKGAVQYVADLRNLGPEPAGMVGEPEGQMELPLPRENKMRITKSQLQRVIREAIEEERRLSGAEMADREFAQVRSGERLPMPEKAEIEEVLDDVLQDIRKNAMSDHIAKQGARAEVLLSMLMGGSQAAGMYKDMFGDRGLKGYMDDRYGD
ncbi:MAG: hypothetical protein VW270_22270 [Candidatus Poseidoniales archaeon]